MLAFAGAYEKRDLHAAAALHLTSQGGLLIACTFAFVALVLSIASTLFAGPRWLLGLAACFVAVFFWLVIRLVLYVTAERTYRTSALLRVPIRGSASSEHVEIQSEHGGGKLPWAVFYQQRQSEDLVLLYQAANLYHLYPRRFFGPDSDWAEFRSLAASNVTARPRSPWRTALTIALVVLGLLLLATVFLGA
jgi:hypothetical protein